MRRRLFLLQQQQNEEFSDLDDFLRRHIRGSSRGAPLIASFVSYDTQNVGPRNGGDDDDEETRNA